MRDFSNAEHSDYAALYYPVFLILTEIASIKGELYNCY